MGMNVALALPLSEEIIKSIAAVRCSEPNLTLNVTEDQAAATIQVPALYKPSLQRTWQRQLGGSAVGRNVCAMDRTGDICRCRFPSCRGDVHLSLRLASPAPSGLASVTPLTAPSRVN